MATPTPWEAFQALQSTVDNPVDDEIGVLRQEGFEWVRSTMFDHNQPLLGEIPDATSINLSLEAAISGRVQALKDLHITLARSQQSIIDRMESALHDLNEAAASFVRQSMWDDLDDNSQKIVRLLYIIASFRSASKLALRQHRERLLVLEGRDAILEMSATVSKFRGILLDRGTG